VSLWPEFVALSDVRRRMVTGRHAARLPVHWTQRVGRGSVPGIVEGGVVGLVFLRRGSSDSMRTIGRNAPDRECSTRLGAFDP